MAISTHDSAQILATPIRGMKDLYGVEIEKYQLIVNVAFQVAKTYGYRLIETPIVENTSVFSRTLGGESDVVSKEMYSFVDKGGANITLRPEGTAGVMRAIASNKLFVNNNSPLKLMYCGPMFRYDRPQKGRYRQFHQMGFEHIGEKGPYADVITIALAMEILKNIGLNDVIVHINSLGGSFSRERYTKALVDYLCKYENKLSAVSKLRLKKNPLRILDSKEFTDIEVCHNAPNVQDFLTNEDRQYFVKVLELLQLWSIKYVIDPKLVRGLDYYTHTTFEFKLSNENMYRDALGGGGRYDGLLKLFCSNDVSGVGFALGIERLMMLLGEQMLPALNKSAAVIPVTAEEYESAFRITGLFLNEKIPTELIITGSNIKKRVELAIKRNCSHLVVIGNDEANKKEVSITVVNSATRRNIKYGWLEAIGFLKSEFVI